MPEVKKLIHLEDSEKEFTVVVPDGAEYELLIWQDDRPVTVYADEVVHEGDHLVAVVRNGLEWVTFDAYQLRADFDRMSWDWIRVDQGFMDDAAVAAEFPSDYDAWSASLGKLGAVWLYARKAGKHLQQIKPKLFDRGPWTYPLRALIAVGLDGRAVLLDTDSQFLRDWYMEDAEVLGQLLPGDDHLAVLESKLVMYQGRSYTVIGEDTPDGPGDIDSGFRQGTLEVVAADRVSALCEAFRVVELLEAAMHVELKPLD